MTVFWNAEWLNSNSQRAYPLSEQATLMDVSGSITIPDSFIVAMQLSVPLQAFTNPQLFYILGLTLSPTGYTITVGYEGVPVAVTSFAAATHNENASYALAGISPFDDCVGAVSIGLLDDISQLPAGQYVFDSTGGLLDPDAIRPQISGITSITLVNGSEIGNKLYGDIELIAGTNVQLSTITQVGMPTQIIINAISGAGLNTSCVCGSGAEQLSPILTINGIAADSTGNFRISGESCVTVTQQTNGIVLTNTCASPCCGCKELDALSVQLDLLSNNVTTMQNFQSRLSGEVTQMQLVVLGSRLGDVSCGTST